jgi:hypothetical protein
MYMQNVYNWYMHVPTHVLLILYFHSWFPIPGDTEGIDLTLVYDHLAFAEYSLGNYRKAMLYTKDLLQNGTSAFLLIILTMKVI